MNITNLRKEKNETAEETPIKEEKTPEENKTQKKKIKCRNWPACNKEDCTFYHPTEQVIL